MRFFWLGTAPSTAPLQVAGPSTMEHIVPIGVQLGQGTPSAIQGARPDVRIEQTVQSTQRYGTPPYISGLPYTAPLPYAAYTAPLPSTAPLPYANMPAMSARPSFPMGYYGQGSQFPFVPNHNWMTEREHMLQQQLLQERQQRQQLEAWRASQPQPQPQPPIISSGPLQVEGDVETTTRSASATRVRPEDLSLIKLKLNVQGLHQHLADPPLPRGTTLGGLAQPLGHLRPVPNGLSIG